MRGAFKQAGQRAERLTQLLNRMAPGSVLQNAEFSDLTRRDAPVEIVMRFRAANYGVTRGSEMVLRPKSPFQVTSQFAPREVRYYDVWLPYRQRRFFTERYAIPEGYAVKSLPKSIELSSPWMEYRATVTHDDGSITVTRELVTKSIQIPRAGYDELRRFCVRVDEYEAQGIVLSRERS